MKRIELTDAEYETLLEELASLNGYHWNDDHVHADNCGSKVIDAIKDNTTGFTGTRE